MAYADWLARVQPPWMHGERGQAWARALGSALDRAVDAAVDAVQARHPRYADAVALALIADARAIRRLPPDESLESWRSRIVGAWDWWRWAGTRRGLERELARLGFVAQVVEGPFENFFDGSWHFGDYEGAFTGPAWAEFLLRLWPQGPFQARERTYLRQVVRELKPAHAVLRGVELYAQDRRTFRLRPQVAVVLLDLGTFGDFLFGENQRVVLTGGMSLATWAQGRMVRALVFDGSWTFGEVGF